jgi:hypothetical protein
MSKGKRAEREAAEHYEAAGYRTFRPQESQYGETDIYGLFDILAVPPAGANDKVRLVQVKSNRAAGIEAWTEEAMAYYSSSVHVEFLVRYDGEPGPHTPPERWRLICPFQDPFNRHETVLDERDDDVAGGGEGLTEYLSRDDT